MIAIPYTVLEDEDGPRVMRGPDIIGWTWEARHAESFARELNALQSRLARFEPAEATDVEGGAGRKDDVEKPRWDLVPMDALAKERDDARAEAIHRGKVMGDLRTQLTRAKAEGAREALERAVEELCTTTSAHVFERKAAIGIVRAVAARLAGEETKS